MYERYHIEPSPAKLSSTQMGKFEIIRKDNCLNCGQCMTHCIYDVHSRDESDPRKMAEPVSHLCKNCFSCIQNCPQQALEMVKNKKYESLGNDYWTPHKIFTIWNEAEEGKIPVYGAGFRGRFKGSGFDTIWTDMSEIVRPTRDGIHGREYIATAVDLGRKLPLISDFTKLDSPHLLEVQIPMLFDTNPLGLRLENIMLAAVRAAHQVRTYAYVNIEDYFDKLTPYLESIAFRCPLDKASHIDSVPWKKANLIEIILPSEFSFSELGKFLNQLKKQNPNALLSLGLSSHHLSEEILGMISSSSVDFLNLTADSQGQSPDGEMFISESIRKLHLNLVKRHMRDEITLLGKGGIAAAEHVPKAIICGADAVILDLSLLVATGCRVCDMCRIESCPAELKTLDPEMAAQRIINMTCAWRDQLLEILSAMGIRDVRRLRGEKGRAMFYEEIEKESFYFIFEERPLFK
ncbi:MAG: glutamate synthase-related protein [Candidatus Aminicenantes bacterium]